MQKKSNNTEQAFWIAFGSFFSFGFTIASSMILSRYFLKEDYGTYRQVIYVYMTMLTVFTLGLPKAFSYFLPRVDDDQAKHLIKKITNIFFIVGGLFSVILFFSSDYIATLLRNPDLGYALKIFSPVPLLMLPTMGLEGILSTYRLTKFMAIYTLVTRLAMMICVALPVVLFSANYIQAIIGFVIASFISFILALYFKYYPVKNKGNKPVDITYKQIFHFSLPLLIASLWSIVMSSTDQFFISRYFGAKTFAEYSNGATPLPFVDIVITSTAAVLSPIYSRLSFMKVDPLKEIFPLWNSALEKSIKLVYPLLLFAWFFADSVMIFLYGAQYEVSSIYFRIFNTLFFFKIIGYAALIINIGKSGFYAKINMYSAILLVLLEYISVQFIDSPYFLSALSVSVQIARTLIFLNVIAVLFKTSILNLFPIKLIFKIVLPSAVFLYFLNWFLSDYLQLNTILILIVGFLIYISLFFLYSHFVNLRYYDIFKPLLNKIRK